MSILLIVVITAWVSYVVPKPFMFQTSVVGAFLAVACAIFTIDSTAGSNLACILICLICFGIPVYRLYH